MQNIHRKMKPKDGIVDDRVRVHLSYPSVYINAATVSVRSISLFVIFTARPIDASAVYVVAILSIY